MSERVVFVTPESLSHGPAMPPQMIQDLRGVAEIAPEQIERLAGALRAESGFLDEERLDQIAAEHIHDADCAAAATGAIWNLRPEIVDQAVAMIGAWREADAANAEQFPEEAFKRLQARLPSLVREYPALSRMRKAKHLRTVLGNALENVEFICDARPVFDQNRNGIEGWLPITTLKLLYERQNGMTEEVEIAMDSQQLDTLISKARKAQQKLQVMAECSLQWVVPRQKSS